MSVISLTGRPGVRSPPTPVAWQKLSSVPVLPAWIGATLGEMQAEWSCSITLVRAKRARWVASTRALTRALGVQGER